MASRTKPTVKESYANSNAAPKVVPTPERVHEEGPSDQFGIKIFDSEGGKKAVSAKELYEKLGLDGSHWKRWYIKNIEKNPFAIEKKDWISLALMANERGKFGKDFAITLDLAKKLAMMTRTEVGEKVRNYFIAVEKKLVERSKLMTIWEYAKNNGIKLITGETSERSMIAKRLCKEYKIDFGMTYNETYGFIHAYPTFIIEQAFEI